MPRMGIKEAVNWLVDNDDLTDLIAADYKADDYPTSITFGFACDAYGLTEQQLCDKVKREIQKRGW